MQFNKAFFLIISLSFLEVVGQECPNLVSPLNNATNVPVDTTIRWQAIEGVTGYIVSVGTTNGGTDIINAQANGSSNSIKPSLGLPENTRIYVTITLFFFNRPNITCESQSFTTENVTSVPTCTNLLFPLDGAININGAVNLRWGYASKATGYRITIGSTPGGTQFANNIDLGNTLTYNPPNDFPPDTTIYLKITPYNENGSAPNCQEESFSIGPVATLPGCTKLITPPNGATNVPLSPLIEWEPVPGATGYKVYIGKTPTENDILDGGSFSATSTFVFNFESNNQYFVRIIPFNAAGQALDCQQETFSTILGCGPFYDISNGELVSLNPEFEFPEEVGICSGSATTVEAGVEADGFRWYSVGQFNDVLISSQASITLNQPGTYLLEAYNFTENGAVECPT
ncbi:MAG: Ig-like domain-containing protein, partial [Flavobacteriaceae bacterium]|nr:Ig-like domain-containing protein [Flavobacteriaceae bacterium]